MTARIPTRFIVHTYLADCEYLPRAIGRIDSTSPAMYRRRGMLIVRAE